MKTFLKEHKLDDFNTVHVTSDTHFRHDKIIDFEPIREQLRHNENFEGTPDEFLIYKWNKQVAKDDLVIHLGDLHWKSLEPIINQLNGTILLVLGNHDMKPQYYYKFENIFPVEGVWCLDNNSEYFTGSKDGLLSGFHYKGVMFCHYPIYNMEQEKLYDKQSKNKIVPRMETLENIMKQNNIMYNIHGHNHSKIFVDDKSLNVCIDYNKFKIFKLHEVLDKVKDK